VFHKKTVPFVISLYLFFYKAEFHENPPEYTRGIGHYEHKIDIRDSLTILCHCHCNAGTAKCQENKHKTRFILMQTSVYVNTQQRKSPFIAKTVQHWYFTTNVQNVRRLQKHKHGDADATA